MRLFFTYKQNFTFAAIPYLQTQRSMELLVKNTNSCRNTNQNPTRMISAESFRRMALNFDAVNEKPHFDKASFRVNKKIFSTLDGVKKTASLKLPVIEQSVYCQIRPVICIPATGAWGKHGWTIFDLKEAPRSILLEALEKAIQMCLHQEIKNNTNKIKGNLNQTR